MGNWKRNALWETKNTLWENMSMKIKQIIVGDWTDALWDDVSNETK